ncbi:MAG: alpha/beta hydrolase [Chloroflexota bacterium]
MSKGTQNANFESIGEGIPIISLHGWSGSSAFGIRLLEPVFENHPGWQRFYLDLPGHGKTPAPSWIKNSDGMLEFVQDFIQEHIGDSPFAIVTSSYSAIIARAIIHRTPEKVLGYCGVVPMSEADDAKRVVPDTQVLIKEDAGRKLLTEVQKERFGNILVIQSEAVIKKILADIEKELPVDEIFLDSIRSDPTRYGLSTTIDKFDQPFEKPSLFIMGRQDNVCGYQQTWDNIEDYPRATFAVLDRAGHILSYEHPALAQTLVGDWLDRVKETITE